MAYLILVRHGRSEWNDKGLWTGLTDVDLTDRGCEEARKTGVLLKDFKVDIAYTSKLKRAKNTLDLILKELKITVPVIESVFLNERDYGVFTGKNKWEVKDSVGEEKFNQIRRSWNFPIDKGESLKQVYLRTIPYYKNQILPELKKGNNVLVVAHGNSLRSLAKFIEKISDEKISELEIGTAEALVYGIDSVGNMVNKNKISENSNKV